MLAATKDFWKRYWALGLLLTMLAYVLLAQIVPDVYAQPYNQELLQRDLEQFLQGLQTTSLSMMKDAYTNCKELFDPDYMTTNSAIAGYKTITDFIRGIGFGMVIVYFLLAIIKESLRGEDFGMEAWTRLLVQLGLALTVIIFLPDILSALFKFGDTVITTFSDSLKPQKAFSGMGARARAEEATSLASDIEKKLLDAGNGKSGIPGVPLANKIKNNEAVEFFEGQNMGMYLNLYSWVVHLPQLACMYLIYAAIFECKLRELFAPIAVASITYEGARSAGMRYLKKYLAIFVKMGIYYVIAAIGQVVTIYFFYKIPEATAEQVPIFLIMGLMGNVVAALTMMQMGGMADEIVGV